jgi:hypothetical protein
VLRSFAKNSCGACRRLSRSVYDLALNLICLRHTSTITNSENLMREIYLHNLLRHA